MDEHFCIPRTCTRGHRSVREGQKGKDARLNGRLITLNIRPGRPPAYISTLLNSWKSRVLPERIVFCSNRGRPPTSRAGSIPTTPTILTMANIHTIQRWNSFQVICKGFQFHVMKFKLSLRISTLEDSPDQISAFPSCILRSKEQFVIADVAEVSISTYHSTAITLSTEEWELG